MSDQETEDLIRELRRYSAQWVKAVAPYFGVTERTLNRCLSDLYGSVMNADLALMYTRLATLFTAIADGQIRGTPTVDSEEKVFYRDVDLDTEPSIPGEIRDFNVQIVKHLNERFSIPISTINRGLFRDYGSVNEADTGQLFTRAAAVLRMCAEHEETPAEERIDHRRSRKGKIHSEKWWETHRVYTDQVKRAADLYSLSTSTVNSEMHSRRGPIHDENDEGIAARLDELIKVFPLTPKEIADE